MLAATAVGLHFVGATGAVFMVASVGASAVLVFGVPHGPLSQPWPLLGGHLVSAFVGVSCAKLVPDPAIAAALAVGVSITAMHYMRCLHPPGGATALTAVLGGPPVVALGYGYVLTPVLLNVLILLVVGVVANYPFPWRRYPICLADRQCRGMESQELETLPREDLVYALRELNHFVDITEDELERIYTVALRHVRQGGVELEAIRAGRCYSNGAFGEEWAIRQVVGTMEEGRVEYRVVAGRGRRTSGACSREEFAAWARYEVSRHETTWQKILPAPA